jgi:hypothetical protein
MFLDSQKRKRMDLSMLSTEEELLSILKENFDLEVRPDQYNLSLFSSALGLRARNLVDVIFILESRFNMKFSEDILTQKEVSTFSGLLKAIDLTKYE